MHLSCLLYSQFSNTYVVSGNKFKTANYYKKTEMIDFADKLEQVKHSRSFIMSLDSSSQDRDHIYVYNAAEQTVVREAPNQTENSIVTPLMREAEAQSGGNWAKNVEYILCKDNQWTPEPLILTGVNSIYKK